MRNLINPAPFWCGVNKEHLFLFFIVFLGAIFRFWNLTTVPPSLSHDEVAIGYNAYSILQTGKDEYGSGFPLLFRSFDDYKLPGMIYSTVPSIWIFGLNEFGVRFPSALLGTLTVLITYFLIKELFGKRGTKQNQTPQLNAAGTFDMQFNYAEYLPLLSSFFLAISPWHINFSRQAFESNGSLFFLVVGTYFLLKSDKNVKYLILSSLFYVFSLYFYYSVRVILPFILLSFLIIRIGEIKKNLKICLFSLFLGTIILFPLLSEVFSEGGFSRINIVSVVNDENYFRRSSEFSKIMSENENIFTKIIYNRRVALGITVGENYLKNVSLNNLFIEGAGSYGLMHLFEAPFFFLGIIYLAGLKTKLKWILIAWLISAPLAGAFTFNQPNSLRTLPNAPMFSTLSAIGLVFILNLIENKNFNKVFTAIFLLTLTVSLWYFSYTYYVQFSERNPLGFGDGYKQMVRFVDENEDKYKAVYISGYYWRPYIFTLFWKKYDPAIYQSKGSVAHFGKYYFSSSQWDKEGIYLGDLGIDFYKLTVSSKPQETLFILAKPEFDINKDEFNAIAVIDGKHSKGVFVAGVLK